MMVPYPVDLIVVSMSFVDESPSDSSDVDDVVMLVKLSSVKRKKKIE